MKSICSWLTIMAIIMLAVVGCGTAKADKQTDLESESKIVANEYKSKLYTISDYKAFSGIIDTNTIADNFKPFFTDQGFNRFMANRIPTIPLDAAAQGKFNLKLKNITFKTVSVSETKAVFDYDLTLTAMYPETNSQKDTDEKGQITLVNENNVWKIDNDHIDINSLFKDTLKIK